MPLREGRSAPTRDGSPGPRGERLPPASRAPGAPAPRRRACPFLRGFRAGPDERWWSAGRRSPDTRSRRRQHGCAGPGRDRRARGTFPTDPAVRGCGRHNRSRALRWSSRSPPADYSSPSSACRPRCIIAEPAMRHHRVLAPGTPGNAGRFLGPRFDRARMVVARSGRRGARMIVHLIDGTYELFRHFYGARRFNEGRDRPLGAVVGVLNTVLEMIEKGATHLGVATDHVIESFRNELWDTYKTGEGIEPALSAQFIPLEDALTAMGIATWPMIELEADDALASAAHLAARDDRVERVCIWTPDKDLAQCVVGDRVVQMDRKTNTIRNAEGVRAKYGVDPRAIPDFLALVGDAADGYPGIEGIGKATAARLVAQYGPLEDFPAAVLDGERRQRALLFKKLATLRIDAPLFARVDELKWQGPKESFEQFASRASDERVLTRARKAADR